MTDEEIKQLAEQAGFALDGGDLFAEHREGLATKEVLRLARLIEERLQQK